MPILVESGQAKVDVDVEVVTFELVVDMDSEEYDEGATVAQLAAYYGVDPALISVEAAVMVTVEETSRRQLQPGLLSPDADERRRRLSEKVVLTVTITVPPSPPSPPASAGSAAGDMLVGTPDDSVSAEASDGGGGGGLGSSSSGSRFAERLAADFDLSSLTAALGHNVTSASDMEVETVTQQVERSCPAGYWCSAALTIACGRNTYSSLVDQISAGACTPCAPNAVSEEASTSAADCRCAEGFYNARSTDLGPTCLLCPTPGSDCSAEGTTLETLQLESGYWRLSPLSVDLRRCPDQWRVEDDDPKTTSTCLGGNGGCANGTAGPLCTLCDSAAGESAADDDDGAESRGLEYYDTKSNACMPCAGRPLGTTLILAIVAICVAPLVAVSLKVARKDKSMRRTLEKLGRLRNKISPRAKFKILFSFFQIINKIATVYHVDMPGPVLNFLEALPMFSADVNMLGPMACLGFNGFVMELTVVLGAPIMLVVAITLGSLVSKVGGECLILAGLRKPPKKASADEDEDDEDDLLGGSVVDLAEDAVVRPLKEQTAREKVAAGLRDALYNALPYVLVVFYSCAPMAYNKAFSMFACDAFEEMPPDLPDAEEGRILSYLAADYNVLCDEGDAKYRTVTRLGWAILLIFCVGVPVTYASLIAVARKPIMNEMVPATRLSRAVQFLCQDFKPGYFYWEFVDVARKVLLIGFFRLVKPGTLQQLMYATTAAAFFFVGDALAHPYKSIMDNHLALCCDFALLQFFVFCLVLRITSITNSLPGLSAYVQDIMRVARSQLSTAMIATLASALGVCGLLVLVTIRDAALEEARARAKAEKEMASRGRMSMPPVTEWKLAQGNKYCTFLSHYKVEAGSDARYLSDLIKRMTGAASYLDSVDLVDLRMLFQHGVLKSDVLVILATKGVLTRPWCLMEMWEAAKNKVPIVIFPVVGGGFTLDDAAKLLGDLDSEMPSRNPACLAEVMGHVRKQGVTDVREVEDVLLAHIGVVSMLERKGRPAGLPPPTFAVGARVRHAERGTGTVTELMSDGRTVVVFESGETHRYKPTALHKLKALQAEEAASSAASGAIDAGAAGIGAALVVDGEPVAGSPPPSPPEDRLSAASEASPSRMSMSAEEELGTEYDKKLAKHLGRSHAELHGWLEEHHKTVVDRMTWLNWQSWGTDNQIIASVQALMTECTKAMGREPILWTERLQEQKKKGMMDRTSSFSRGSKGGAGGLLRRTASFQLKKGGAAEQEHMLIICHREESGAHVRRLQQEFESNVGCPVVVGSDSWDTWRQQATLATHGVVLLQTKTVLRHPVRLLQLFEGVQQGHPLACVNVVGGGYAFEAVNPLLRSLSTELPEFSTFHSVLAEGGSNVGKLVRTLSKAVPNSISVFFNPIATEAVQDAAIKDVIDKLGKSKAIGVNGGSSESREEASAGVPIAVGNFASASNAWKAGRRASLAGGAFGLVTARRASAATTIQARVRGNAVRRRLKAGVVPAEVLRQCMPTFVPPAAATKPRLRLGDVTFRLKAHHLVAKDVSLFGRSSSDPYYILLLKLGDGSLRRLGKSNVVKQSLAPEWEPLVVAGEKLSGSRRVVIQVWDLDDQGLDDLIGETEAELPDLHMLLGSKHKEGLVAPPPLRLPVHEAGSTSTQPVADSSNDSAWKQPATLMHRQNSSKAGLHQQNVTKAKARPVELLSKVRRHVEAAADAAADAAANAAITLHGSSEHGCGIVSGTVSVCSESTSDIESIAAAAPARGLKGQTKLVSAASAAAADFHGTTRLTCGSKGGKPVAAARLAHLGAAASSSRSTAPDAIAAALPAPDQEQSTDTNAASSLPPGPAELEGVPEAARVIAVAAAEQASSEATARAMHAAEQAAAEQAAGALPSALATPTTRQRRTVRMSPSLPSPEDMLDGTSPGDADGELESSPDGAADPPVLEQRAVTTVMTTATVTTTTTIETSVVEPPPRATAANRLLDTPPPLLRSRAPAHGVVGRLSAPAVPARAGPAQAAAGRTRGVVTPVAAVCSNPRTRLRAAREEIKRLRANAERVAVYNSARAWLASATASAAAHSSESESEET